MLFHMSIAAKDPQRVAGVFAELWGGQAMPFPPVAEGSWMAVAGDARGTSMEVYPEGTVLKPGGEPGSKGEPQGFTPTHAAVGTPLSREAVMAIAQREAWPAEYMRRGGNLFGVIELWIEGRQMIEVLTPEMQAEYLDLAANLGKLKGKFEGASDLTSHT